MYNKSYIANLVVFVKTSHSHVMFSFSRPTQIIVYRGALQFWKVLHFEIDVVWALMVQVHGVKNKSLHITNVMF